MRGIAKMAATGIVGLVVGVHMRGAGAASPPCPVASPTAVAATPAPGAHKIKLILVWRDSTAAGSYIEPSKTFTIRGPFTVTVVYEPIDPNKVATANGVFVGNQGTNDITEVGPPVALDIGAKPVTYQQRVTDNRCQFTCDLDMSNAKNMKWTATVAQ